MATCYYLLYIPHQEHCTKAWQAGLRCIHPKFGLQFAPTSVLTWPFALIWVGHCFGALFTWKICDRLGCWLFVVAMEILSVSETHILVALFTPTSFEITRFSIWLWWCFWSFRGWALPSFSLNSRCVSGGFEVELPSSQIIKNGLSGWRMLRMRNPQPCREL